MFEDCSLGYVDLVPTLVMMRNSLTVTPEQKEHYDLLIKAFSGSLLVPVWRQVLDVMIRRLDGG